MPTNWKIRKTFATHAAFALTVAVSGALAIASAGCGDSSSSQESARDRATIATCDHYMKCGNIGPGQRFATRQDCEVEGRADWNRIWPSAECDGRINADALNTCLTVISISECGSGLDVLNALDKCQKAKVCIGQGAGP